MAMTTMIRSIASLPPVFTVLYFAIARRGSREIEGIGHDRSLMPPICCIGNPAILVWKRVGLIGLAGDPTSADRCDWFRLHHLEVQPVQSEHTVK